MAQHNPEHREKPVGKAPKRLPGKAAVVLAVAAISLAHAGSARAVAEGPNAPAPSTQGEGRAAGRPPLPAKRAAERRGATARESSEITFTHGPAVAVTTGDLTTRASIISNPLPTSADEGEWATVRVSFEASGSVPETIEIATPTTWKAGHLKDIISSRDSKYSFFIFEKCVVVALGYSSVKAGETRLTVDRDGESVQLPSNSFHFMLPEDAQGDDLFRYEGNSSGFYFLNREGVLRVSPIDVQGSFLRTDIGAPEEGTRLLFARGLLFVVRPAQNCITAFDPRLNPSEFLTGEQLSGEPVVSLTEMGFEATFTTASGGLATYKAAVQSEGLLSSFVATQLRND